MKDYNFFKASELRCKCGHCDGGGMNDYVMGYYFCKARHLCGFPWIITSAYRCLAHNKNVGGASNSGHLYGRAMDIAVSNPQAFQLVRHCLDVGINAIGVSQRSGKSRYIHIEYRDNFKGTIWSY